MTDMVLSASVPAAADEAPGPFPAAFPQEGQNAAVASSSFPQFPHVISNLFNYAAKAASSSNDAATRRRFLLAVYMFRANLPVRRLFSLCLFHCLLIISAAVFPCIPRSAAHWTHIPIAPVLGAGPRPLFNCTHKEYRLFFFSVNNNSIENIKNRGSRQSGQGAFSRGERIVLSGSFSKRNSKKPQKKGVLRDKKGKFRDLYSVNTE